jgi:hypothetical protein
MSLYDWMEEYVEAELVFLLGKPWLGSYHLSRVSGEVYSMGWMAECDITLSNITPPPCITST